MGSILSVVRPIVLAEPHLTESARRYLGECLDTNYVSSVGPFVGRFETAFAKTVGARRAVACASGTAAIHVAMRLLGVGAGDEVWVSSLTFVGSVNPILYQGATPVFVDSESVTWNMDPAIVDAALADRKARGIKMPKVIEVVHLLGHPADMKAFSGISERYGVPIIEDAAEALGARYDDGRFPGSIAKIGCHSFNGNKIITSGGGGMIVTNDESLGDRAKHLTMQAKLPGEAYWHDEVGYNYRLTNIAAALGLSQLESLDTFVEKKRALAARYDKAFANVPWIELPPRAAWAKPTFWLYTIRLKPGAPLERDGLMKHLASQGIQSRPIWTPLPRMEIYRGFPRVGGNVSDQIFETALSLPSSVGLTEEDQARVIDVVKAAGG